MAEEVPERQRPDRLDEPDRTLDRPHLDHVADPDREVLAAVDRDERLEGIEDSAANDGRRAYNYRADRREVARDRCDDEVARGRIEDRPAENE